VLADNAGRRLPLQVGDPEGGLALLGRVAVGQPAAELLPAMAAAAVAEEVAVGDEAVDVDGDGRLDEALLHLAPGRLVDAAAQRLRVDPAAAASHGVGLGRLAGRRDMAVVVRFLEQLAGGLRRPRAQPLLVPEPVMETEEADALLQVERPIADHVELHLADQPDTLPMEPLGDGLPAVEQLAGRGRRLAVRRRGGERVQPGVEDAHDEDVGFRLLDETQVVLGRRLMAHAAVEHPADRWGGQLRGRQREVEERHERG
jgi:hypothetical protein